MKGERKKERKGGTNGLVTLEFLNIEFTSLVPKAFINIYTFLYLFTYLYLPESIDNREIISILVSEIRFKI